MFTCLAPAAVALAVSCPQESEADPSPPPAFRDVSEASGLRLNNFEPDPEVKIPINDHSRLAFAELNGDGRDDVVMHSLFPNPQRGIPFEHLVFLNRGGVRFGDFSDASGLRRVQAAFFAFADVDGDGDQDLFAGLDLDGYGDHTSSLRLNDGSGRFAARAESGVEGAPFFRAACATFADFDGDAALDLFVGNGGTSAAAPDFLYAGDGEGGFTDVSGRLANRPSQPSNGCLTADYDDDGDLDVFVSTYGVSRLRGLNHLWENDGEGRFAEVAVARGFAALATGNPWVADGGQPVETGRGPGEHVGSNGFGLDCGDVDGDGHLDLFLTAISHPAAGDYLRRWSDSSQLLINGGPEAGYAFTDRWLERGLPFNEGDVDGALIDYDNDGRLDLSISRDRKYERRYADLEQKAWFGLMRQRADGGFASVGYASGINDPAGELLRMKSAQNHAWSDVDGDGDLDLLVGGRDQGGGRPNFLFENLVGQDAHWLAVRVEGDGEQVDRDGFGTRLRLHSAAGVQLREKKSARGMYNSEDTRVLHFGLGSEVGELALEVRWLEGTTARFEGAPLAAGAYLRLRYPDRLEREERR